MPSSDTQFKPGQKPKHKPPGRPKGSKDKLSQEVIDTVLADWKEHGEAAVRECREKNPAVYFRTVASMLPKDINVTQTADDELKRMTEEQLIDLLARLGSSRGTARAESSKRTGAQKAH